MRRISPRSRLRGAVPRARPTARSPESRPGERADRAPTSPGSGPAPGRRQPDHQRPAPPGWSSRGEGDKGRPPTDAAHRNPLPLPGRDRHQRGQTSIVATDLGGGPLGRASSGPAVNRNRSSGARRPRQADPDHPEFGRHGIGVVVSGLVDLHGGQLKYSPTLGWRDVDLVGPLSAITQLPVSLENSVKACILAQVWAVSGDSPMDGPVAFVSVSDGSGVGIAVDGKLLRGAHNIAGESGHVPLNMFSPICSCGRRGCPRRAYRTAPSSHAISAWTRRGRACPPTGDRRGASRARAPAKAGAQTPAGIGHYLGRGFATIGSGSEPHLHRRRDRDGWDVRVHGPRRASERASFRGRRNRNPRCRPSELTRACAAPPRGLDARVRGADGSVDRGSGFEVPRFRGSVRGSAFGGAGRRTRNRNPERNPGTAEPRTPEPAGRSLILPFPS